MSRVLLTDVRPEALKRAVEEAVGRELPWVDPEDAHLDDVDVWFCAGPPPGRVLTLPSLEWIHSGWAGVEGWFRRPEWNGGVRLTRTVADFPERMAEYVFAYLLAQELGVDREVRKLLMGHAPGTDAHDRYTHRSRSLVAAADLVSGWLRAALDREPEPAGKVLTMRSA